MTAQAFDSRHPVTTAVARVRDDLREVARTPVWSMGPGEAGLALVEVTRLAAQVAQLQMRLLAHADRVQVGADVGATSAAIWLAHETRTPRPVVHRRARLAARLEEAHQDVDEVLADGALTLDQAEVIVEAVDALPTDLVDVDTIRRAEAFLLEQARDHDARALRILGRRLLDVVDPEAADLEEARRLEAEESEARADASFTLSDDGHGQVRGRFTLPALHGSMLRKHLMALAAPGRNPERPASTPGRHAMGLAFAEYVETRPDGSVPRSGGLAASVVVTMTLESLMGGLLAAGLCDGSRISAGEARRLACSAGIIPVVLGGPSEPLDVGRQRRFHTKAMRVGLGLRDGGCSTVGCDRPPALCHAHHDQPWGANGHTNLETGRLLCARHHTLAHDRRFETTSRPGGKISFTRRT
ncbi:DUF222 domain-containing protein [Nocardioides sp. GXQ0305]|uniref:HNH endonuclease signature motif containing protein n=1 Tax=Nocardioides sp. GXQ0305 TaxID=3423912 RepID=UPI003D7D9151